MNPLCSQCGENVPEDFDVCPYCGTLVVREKDEEGNAAIGQDLSNGFPRCQNCGVVLDGKETFCGRCGFLVDGPGECRDCRTRIGAEDRYCTGCGRLVRPEKLQKSSRPIAALLLGLIPGMFSIWGLGQFFSASMRKGILFFVLGLVLALVAPVSLVVLISDIGELAGLSILGLVLWVALWILQAIDAYWEAGGE
ncbi:MAG: zinc ribbon domain-containing protein [Methanomassiliicoccus sp.]|nr:zinc ribbon domain-containing protein [Methanomassiliicoccus sp.]